MDAQTNGIGTLILVRIGYEPGSKFCTGCTSGHGARCVPFQTGRATDGGDEWVRCLACLKAEAAFARYRGLEQTCSALSEECAGLRSALADAAPTSEQAALVNRERLAALQHEQWTYWTRHLLDNLDEVHKAGWERQIATPYADLCEQEKDSDRAEADRVLALLGVGPVIGVEIGRVLADWDAFGEGISLIPCRVVRSLCAALAADGITLPAQAQGPQAEDAGGGDAL